MRKEVLLPYVEIPDAEIKTKIKLAPFKAPANKPYGGFANTTPCGIFRVTQIVTVDGKDRTFNWPSAEHAYHAQKILYLKTKLSADHAAQTLLTEMLTAIEKHPGNSQREFLPREHYDRLVANYLENDLGKLLDVFKKPAFDALCGADYHPKHKPEGERKTLDFMRKVVELKLRQHTALKELAIACAEQGIFPVEVSERDMTWASGFDGSGENRLGVIILEIGNELVKEADKRVPAIADPLKFYNSVREKHAGQLTHNELLKFLNLSCEPVESAKPAVSSNNQRLFGQESRPLLPVPATEVENTNTEKKSCFCCCVS